jgi:hypothetical protein
MSVDLGLLVGELTAAGLPVNGGGLLALTASTAGYTASTFYTRAEGIIRVQWSSFPPTGPQDTQAAAVVAAHGGPRVKRTLFAIRADIAALTASQKTNAWAALIAGSPPLWSQDAGPNAAALATIQMLGASVTLSAADVLEAKTRAAAFYVQDNVKWLVNPVFDPTIAIAGDMPAP